MGVCYTETTGDSHPKQICILHLFTEIQMFMLSVSTAPIIGKHDMRFR